MKYIFLFSFFLLYNKGFSQDFVSPYVVTDKVNHLLELRTDCVTHTKITHKLFHIQIYNGHSLAKAKQMKLDFKDKFPEIPATIEWENPEFKLWVGDYENKLSADRGLLKIKTEYPNAFIVNPKK